MGVGGGVAIFVVVVGINSLIVCCLRPKPKTPTREDYVTQRHPVAVPIRRRQKMSAGSATYVNVGCLAGSTDVMKFRARFTLQLEPFISRDPSTTHSYDHTPPTSDLADY